MPPCDDYDKFTQITSEHIFHLCSFANGPIGMEYFGFRTLEHGLTDTDVVQN